MPLLNSPAVWEIRIEVVTHRMLSGHAYQCWVTIWDTPPQSSSSGYSYGRPQWWQGLVNGVGLFDRQSPDKVRLGHQALSIMVEDRGADCGQEAPCDEAKIKMILLVRSPEDAKNTVTCVHHVSPSWRIFFASLRISSVCTYAVPIWVRPDPSLLVPAYYDTYFNRCLPLPFSRTPSALIPTLQT